MLRPEFTEFYSNLDSLGQGKMFQENMDTVLEKTNDENKELNDLEDKFNRLLSEYTKTVKLISVQLVEKNEKKNIAKSLYGKVVIFKNGQKAYINNYGFGHRFSPDAWEKRDKSCNSIEECQSVGCDLVFNSIPLKNDMVPGQPCGIEGNNVQNTSSKEYAWVDIYGIKHIYPDEVFSNKKSSCDKTAILLSSEAYNSIPNGEKMTSKTPCLNIDVDVNLHIKLDEINESLLKVADEMNNKLNQFSVEDKEMSNEYNKRSQILRNNIKKLKSDQIKLQKSQNGLSVGLLDDIRINMDVSYYNYLTWSIVALTIVGFSIKQIVK